MLHFNRLATLTTLTLALASGYVSGDENVVIPDPSVQVAPAIEPVTVAAEPATTQIVAPMAFPSATFTQDESRKLSEAFGHLIGKSLHAPGFTFDLESIVRGIRDGAEGKESPLTPEQYEELLVRVQEHAYNEFAATNRKEADTFLAENAKAGHVVELEPGRLQYVILQPGEGSVVENHSAPLIHYTGSYLDGTVFGSTEQLGEPIAVPLDNTIPGFTRAIIGMKQGEKRRIYVHPDLGYGAESQLSPNALLVFDVEVVQAIAATNELFDVVVEENQPLEIEMTRMLDQVSGSL